MARYVGVYLHLKFSDCELEALMTKEIQRRQSWGSTGAQVYLEAAELMQNITQHAVCCPSLHLQSRRLIPFNQYSYRVAFSSHSMLIPTDPVFLDSITPSPQTQNRGCQQEGFCQFIFFKCLVLFHFVLTLNLFLGAVLHHLDV